MEVSHRLLPVSPPCEALYNRFIYSSANQENNLSPQVIVMNKKKKPELDQPPVSSVLGDQLL